MNTPFEITLFGYTVELVFIISVINTILIYHAIPIKKFLQGNAYLV